MKTLQVFLLLIFTQLADSNSCGFSYPLDLSGYCIKSTECPGASFQHNCASDVTRCCVLETTLSFTIPSSNFSQSHFLDIFGKTTRNEGLYDYFIAAMDQGNIKTCHQQAAFAAQVAFDTNYLVDMAERIDKKTASPNDLKYKGRGGIQIRGEGFYQWLSTNAKIHILDRPDVLMFPSMAFKVAAVTWFLGYAHSSTDTINYNELANGSEYNFALISDYLHGNLDGIKERLKLWRKAMSVLQCDCDVPEDGGLCIVHGQTGTCRMTSDCHGRHVEVTNQCRGTSSIFQCCLDCNGKIDVGLVLDARITTSVMALPGLDKFINDLINRFKISLNDAQFTVGIYKNSTGLDQLERYSSKSSLTKSIAKLISSSTMDNKALKPSKVNMASMFNNIFSHTSIADSINKEENRKILLFLTKKDKNSIIVLNDYEKFIIGQNSGIAIALNVYQGINSHYTGKNNVWNVSMTTQSVSKIANDVCSAPQIINDISEIKSAVVKSEKRYFKFVTMHRYINIDLMEGAVYVNESTRAIGQHTSCQKDISIDLLTLNEVLITKKDNCYVIELISEVPQKHEVTLVITGGESHNIFTIKTTNSQIHNNKKRDLSAIIFICSIVTMAICTLILIIFIISQCHYAYKTSNQKSRSSSECEGSLTDSLYCSRKISNSSRRALIESEEIKIPKKLDHVYLTMVPFFSYFMLLTKGQCMSTIKKYRNHRFWFDIQCSKILSLIMYIVANFLVMQKEMSKAKCLTSMALTGYAGLSMLLWILVEFWHLYGGVKDTKMPRFISKTLAYFVAWGAPLPIVGISVILSFENTNMDKSCWRHLNEWHYWLFGSTQILLILIAMVCCFLVLKNKTVLKDCKHPSKLSRFNSKVVSSAIFFAACLAVGIATELVTFRHQARIFKISLIVTYVLMIAVLTFIYVLLLPEVKETCTEICERLGWNCCLPVSSALPVVSIETKRDSNESKNTLDVPSDQEPLKAPLNRMKSLSSGDLPWTTRKISRDDMNSNFVTQNIENHRHTEVTFDDKPQHQRKVTTESFV